MALVTMCLLPLGVVLSAVSGLVCYLGTSSVIGQIDWLPYSDLVLANPTAALGLGIAVTIACAWGLPSRVE